MFRNMVGAKPLVSHRYKILERAGDITTNTGFGIASSGAILMAFGIFGSDAPGTFGLRALFGVAGFLMLLGGGFIAYQGSSYLTDIGNGNEPSSLSAAVINAAAFRK